MTRVLIRHSLRLSFRLVTSVAFCLFVSAMVFAISTAFAPRLSAQEDTDSDSDEVSTEEVTSPNPAVRVGPPPPVGVRLGEPIEANQLRVAYRFVRTQSQGLLIGDRDISASRVRQDLFTDFEQSPRSLEVTAHVFEVAYAPHPRVTFVVEVPFIEKELERVGACVIVENPCEDQTEGVGDLSFSMLIPFIRKGVESSHLHLGFDVPTGSIRRGDGPNRLPYDSQIGNGTVDLEWGWTYRGDLEWVSWGGQVVGRHPVGRNDLNYREGSRFEASLWGALRIVSGISTSLRVGWEKRNNLSGQDSQFVPLTDASTNPFARGGTVFTISPGLAIEVPQLDDQRLSVEFGIPVHQDLDGPQLERDWSATVGWQWAF